MEDVQREAVIKAFPFDDDPDAPQTWRGLFLSAASDMLRYGRDETPDRRLVSLDGWLDDAARIEEATRPSTPEDAIAANTIIPAPMVPGKDSILETYADADEMNDLGNAASALESPYRKPKDKRVQKLIRDAEAARAAEKPVGRVFTDPRLDPNYKPPRQK